MSKTELKKAQNNLLASINDPPLAKRVAKFAGQARREIASEKIKNRRLEQKNKHLSQRLSQIESDASANAREHDETRDLLVFACESMARRLGSMADSINFIQEYIVTSSCLQGFQLALMQKALEFDGFCSGDFNSMIKGFVENANRSLAASGFKRSKLVLTDNYGINIQVSPADDVRK